MPSIDSKTVVSVAVGVALFGALVYVAKMVGAKVPAVAAPVKTAIDVATGGN